MAGEATTADEKLRMMLDEVRRGNLLAARAIEKYLGIEKNAQFEIK